QAQGLDDIDVVRDSRTFAGQGDAVPAEQARRFSASARAVAAQWVRQQSAPMAANDRVRPGDVLHSQQLLVARIPPAYLARALATPPGCVDLLLDNRLVRLERSTRRVVDCGPEIG
ncbi:MAG: hypothetical protein ACPG43_03105, partial [Alcanivoracaceae bacterium]